MEQAYLETQSKLANDVVYRTQPTTVNTKNPKQRSSSGPLMMVTGPVIVGAGPSGLAVAACLRSKGIPSLVLERSNCIASLWQLKTYDRLRLHLPKQFCQLPLLPFPAHYPTYPTRAQFVDYLETYAAQFGIRPVFGRTVVNAEFDHGLGVWRVMTSSGKDDVVEEYGCKWLVVATGENAEVVTPDIDGIRDFGGEVMHSCQYRSGQVYEGKKVLVVGCGNSGMEVSLDLCHHNSFPTMVVRDTVHVLPREMMGRSTFSMSMWMLKWLPVTWVDQILLILSRQVLGDTSELGLIRPKLGPLQLKNLSGKTPVLDVGTLDKIRSGEIKVRPAIRRLKRGAAEFIDGRTEEFDAVILATGYKSNVPYWLNETEMFNKEDGLPRNSFPEGWKGQCGLYAVGFTRKGLPGATMDARRIAEDVETNWRSSSSSST